MSTPMRRTRLAVRRNVFDPQGDNIAASQLAIDGEVEHRQVTGSLLNLQSGPNGPNVPCQERGLCSDQLPLFQGVRFGRGRNEL
jgi:hypothetical protein